MLTGRTAPSTDKTASVAAPVKVSAPKSKRRETPDKEPAAPPLYNKEETEPSAVMQVVEKMEATDNSLPDTDSSGYQFTAEDDAMLQGAMAAFQNI